MADHSGGAFGGFAGADSDSDLSLAWDKPGADSDAEEGGMGVEVVDVQALSHRVVPVKQPFSSEDAMQVAASSKAGAFKVRFFVCADKDHRGARVDVMVSEGSVHTSSGLVCSLVASRGRAQCKGRPAGGRYSAFLHAAPALPDRAPCCRCSGCRGCAFMP
jgi:hypothetical protein